MNQHKTPFWTFGASGRLRRPAPQTPRRAAFVTAIPLVFVAIVLFVPFVGAAADPTPTPSTSSSAAGPAKAPLSAALFAGTSKAPSGDAWKNAERITGVRMGREASGHGCYVTHIGEWVRVQCDKLGTSRADLVAGEKRDLTLINAAKVEYVTDGDNVVAQFSMRPGDRRVIQWIVQDLWWWTWHGDEGLMASGIQSVGATYGVVAQIDWVSGPEPIMTIY